MPQKKEYLNFQQIKDTASVPVILASMGLYDTFTAKGDEWIGQCPFGHQNGSEDNKYYFRHFVFGLAIAVVIGAFILSNPQSQGMETMKYVILFGLIGLNTFLYPYARYVYESIIKFILGDNFLISNVMTVFITKLITVFMCWGFAMFIAPFGLIYLYFFHTKQEKANGRN